MKKTKYILSVLLIVVIITSCYKDQGNYDYTSIGDIEISGFEDNYSLIAGVDTLRILPEITTSYNEKTLEYTWLIYDKGNNIDTISHEKNLEYIAGKSGSYKLFFYVKNNENGYYVHTTTDIESTTVYSKGHYILKETADGNTDMDLITNSGNLVSDVLLLTQGEHLSGVPRSMGILYSQAYYDPDSLTKENEHCLGIITHNKKFNVLRANDMRLIFDHATKFFEEPDDTPYKFFTCKWANIYLSSNGAYCTYNLDILQGSGMFGFPGNDIAGASDHFGYANMSMVYWDETNKRILFSDYNGQAHILDDVNYPTVGLANYDCLFMGSYDPYVYVLLKDNTTSKLYLYLIETDSYTVVSVTEIDGSSKMYTATHFASNEISAERLYFVENNKVYYYNCISNEEFEMNLTGFSADGEITYISNRHYNLSSPSFDYFTIATHYNDGTYKLYMYEMVGGIPYGEPVITTSGTGKVKEVHYIGTVFKDYYESFGYTYSR